MTTYNPPKKNTEYIFYISLRDQADTKLFKSSATLAAGDAKVSIDGGALNNLGTLPAVTPAASVMVKVTLSAAEMNGDNITFVMSDASGAEWCDLVVNLQTATNQFDGLSTFDDTTDTVDVGKISGDSGAADNLELDYDGTGYAKANSTIGTTTTNTDMVAAAPTAVENRTEMDSNSTQLAAIVADTNELQTDDVPGLIGALNDISTAEVNTQVDTALTDIHLDHLLAATYDPASKPGAADALLNELVENDGGVSRFTENALEQAPSGTGASAATIADAVWDELATGHTDAGKAGAQLWTDIDAILVDTNELQSDDVPTLIAALPTAVENRTEMDSNSTQLAAIVADTNELQSDDVPGLIGALNDISEAEVNTQVDTALSDIHLDHLLAADYDPASKPGVATALLNELVENDGGVSRYTENALEQAPGGSAPTASAIATAVHQYVTESGNPVNSKTFEEITRIMLATLVGVRDTNYDWGAKSPDGITTRIGGSLNSSGERTSIDVLDGS